MIPFDIACPECANSLRVSDPRLVGHRVKCPKCKHQFAVTPPFGHEIDAPNGEMEAALQRSRSAPAGHMTGDLHRLKTNGAEAAAELSEFLKKMRGKSPQEMLGIVAQSGLATGVAQATVGAIVLLAVLTVVPYGLAKAFPPAPKAVAENNAEETPAAKAAPKGEAGPATVDVGGNDQTSKAAKAATRMGENDTKSASPTFNPLENSSDDLLKDLK